MLKWYNHFGEHLEISLKSKHTYSLWTNSNPKYLFKRREYMTTKKKNLQKNVHNSLIHNSPNLETAQVFTNKRMDKQTVAQSHDGILLSNEKEQARDTHNMGESQTCWVKDVKHKHTHCITPFRFSTRTDKTKHDDSNFFLEGHVYTDRKGTQGTFPGWSKLYLERGVGYTDVCICRNWMNNRFKTCVFHCM